MSSDIQPVSNQTYVKPVSKESSDQGSHTAKKIYPKTIDMQKIGEVFAANLTDEQILRQGIYEHLEDQVMSGDLRQRYESGTCQINVEQVFVGPGEFLRVYGPLMGMSQRAIKRESRKEKGQVKKLNLPEGKAHVEAHIIWGPLAARGFAYTLRKDGTDWMLEDTDPYWLS